MVSTSLSLSANALPSAQGAYALHRESLQAWASSNRMACETALCVSPGETSHVLRLVAIQLRYAVCAYIFEMDACRDSLQSRDKPAAGGAMPSLTTVVDHQQVHHGMLGEQYPAVLLDSQQTCALASMGGHLGQHKPYVRRAATLALLTTVLVLIQ